MKSRKDSVLSRESKQWQRGHPHTENNFLVLYCSRRGLYDMLGISSHYLAGWDIAYLLQGPNPTFRAARRPANYLANSGQMSYAMPRCMLGKGLWLGVLLNTCACLERQSLAAAGSCAMGFSTSAQRIPEQDRGPFVSERWKATFQRKWTWDLATYIVYQIISVPLSPNKCRFIFLYRAIVWYKEIHKMLTNFPVFSFYFFYSSCLRIPACMCGCTYMNVCACVC